MENKKELRQAALSNKFRLFLALGGIILAFCSFSTLSADNYYPPRVSHVEGGVSYESAGDVDWSEATINLPIFRGDRVYARPGSRSEIEFGYNSFLRLDENTDVVFSHLSKKAASLNLTLGSVIVRTGRSFEMDVQTAAGLIRLDDKGLYRIDTDETGLTRIMVRKGKAEIVGGGEKLEIRDGQMTTFGGDPTLRQAAYDSYEDDFDLWSSRRDAIYASSNSVEYVGDYYPGIHTLDSYGYWRTYPSIGRVWIPRVGVGWSPYRSGLWLNFSVGWTWLSYEPWGWLPYHHGYWHYYEPYNHWVWSPGFYGGYTSFGAWSPHRVNFYYGNGYIGWAPKTWGYGSRPNNTVINNNTIVINNNNITNSRGMTVVKATDFSRRRVENTMVKNVSTDVRSSFKAGLPDNLVRTSARSSLAAGAASQSRTARSSSLKTSESRAAAATKAGSANLTREIPGSTRAAEYKNSRGSAGTASRSANTAAATRTITTRERSTVNSRPDASGTRGLTESNIKSIPSRNESRATVRSETSTRAVTTSRAGSSSSPAKVTGDRSGSGLSGSSVRSIPSTGISSRGYGESGNSGSATRSSSGRVTQSDSRVRSLTGSSATPRITTDTRTPNSTASKTYRDRSSGTSFWKRIFGGSSSSNRGSSSGGSYSRSRSYGSSGSVSRPSSSSSRPSYSRPSSSSSRPSYSRPSSGSRPSSSSRPSSGSRPKRPN